MAKKGDAAREAVKNTIVEAFKTQGAFAGIQDKKIYVNMQEGGETLQFAISMTMPKTPLEFGEAVASNPNDWTSQASPVAAPAELAPEDKQKIAELMERLGI